MQDPTESERLAALERLEVLDSPSEPLFDSLTELAAQTFNAPIALISLVDHERQWFKACVGLDVDHTSRDISFCQHAILSDQVFVVLDAAHDERFRDNPLVTGPPDIRFYAGAPLITPQGYRLGTICVIDTVPRQTFSDVDASRLQAIAMSVMQALVLRLDSRERERIAAVAEQQNKLLKLAEDMAGVGTWSWDVAADRTTWSDQVYRIHGYEPDVEPPALQGVLERYHPDDAKTLSDHVQRAVTEGRDYALEARIYRPDGSERHVLARGACQKDPSGAVAAIVGTFQDITEHVAAERFIRTLTDNLPGMVGCWDAEMRCRFANAGYREWFGQSPESMLSMTLPELLGPELFAKNERSIRAALNGEAQSFPRTLVKPTGEVGHTWTHYIPDIDASGRVQGMYVLVSDVTALKQAEDELQETNVLLEAARDQAEAAAAVKAEFLANMSHEIRTPLNGILGFAEVLSNTGLDQDQRRYLDRIRTAGKGLSALIDDILDFSKIESGKMTTERRAFDLLGLATDVVELMQVSVAGRLDLQLGFDDGVSPWVMGDEQRTRQVLLNLLGNAAKFTHEGSVILRVGVSAGQLELRVTDTGIGISPDALSRLFQGFTQADTAVSRRFGGTGLGLNISRTLARLMQGDVTLESQPDVGTTAIFTLPYAPAEAQSPPAPASITVSSTRPLKVLAVDDVVANIELLDILLSRAGHAVVCAMSGDAAIEILERDAGFDLVLMDVQMPGMDGLAATRLIRAMANGAQRIPVVALTANVLADQIEACRAAGMDDHLGKPIKMEELLSLLSRVSLLDNRSPTPAPENVATQDPLAELKARYRAQMDRFEGEFARLGALPLDRRADAMAAYSHSIAGTAGSLGFTAVSNAAFDLEAAAKRCRDLGAGPETLDPLIQELVDRVALS